MENLKAFAEQFKKMTLHELHATDEILEKEIASRVHTDAGGGDGDNDADDGVGGIQDDPTHHDV